MAATSNVIFLKTTAAWTLAIDLRAKQIPPRPARTKIP
jgi:hypothetical protein